jgi:hypothetical protein
MFIMSENKCLSYKLCVCFWGEGGGGEFPKGWNLGHAWGHIFWVRDIFPVTYTPGYIYIAFNLRTFAYHANRHSICRLLPVMQLDEK